MEEIKTGEYIRTWDGIKKIVKVNEGGQITYYGKYMIEPEYRNSRSISIKNILKHSFDLIDLIEVRRLCEWIQSYSQRKYIIVHRHRRNR